MKALSFILFCSMVLLGLSGCNLPRHFAKEEVIVYYYDHYDYYQEDPIGGPHPLPDPPYTPITNPVVNNPIDRSPDKSKDGGNSYSQRDPLQGGIHRGSGEIKSDPPVRKPPQKNDRVQ
jgi:hypothetical protein